MQKSKKPTALEKRIKRHVKARRMTFFASTSPGLEEVLKNEISLLPDPPESITSKNGGIEFDADLQTCYIANLLLRSANRILLRLTEFKATNFRHLKKKLSEFPWELYINPNARLETSVSSKNSRLYHSDAISSYLTESIKKRLDLYSDHPCPGNKDFSSKIFLRSIDDTVSISLDSSGDLLYRRGIKTHKAKAPLRESAAAAALILAGYDGSGILIDPMCGAGTFSLEAALIARNIPSGWYREFAFMGWPAFSSPKWRYITKTMEKGIKPPPQSPNIIGTDLNKKAIRDLDKSIHAFGLESGIELKQQDFFDISPKIINDAGTGPGKNKGVIALNPPYGHRIGTKRQSNALFKEIYKKLSKDFKGWRLCMIIPRTDLVKRIPFKIKSYPFKHGGLNIFIITGRI